MDQLFNPGSLPAPPEWEPGTVFERGQALPVVATEGSVDAVG